MSADPADVVVPFVAPGAASVPPVTGLAQGADFETKLTALVLRDRTFALDMADVVRPEHFTNAVERNLVAVTLDFVRRYRAIPDMPVLIKLLSELKTYTPADGPIYVDKIIEASRVDLSVKGFVRERVVDFCKRQAILLAAMRVPDLLDKGKLDDIRKAFEASFAIGEAGQPVFYEYFDRVEERKRQREDMAAGKRIIGVSTGFPEIDAVLYKHGYGRGELTVVMAPSKRGKTAFKLQSSLTSCVTAGTNVLFISLEVDTEILSDRGDACLSSTLMSDLILSRDAVASNVASIGLSPTRGKFYIERFSSASLTTDGVEAVIDRYERAGISLDMVVVDYIGILRLKPSDDRFVGLGNAAKELRRIAGDHDVAMITGAQTNRDAVGKQVSGMDSIGESFAIVQDCDLLLSINANEAEMAAGVRRLFVAASRNSEECTIKVQGDLAKMQLIQTVLGKV